MRNPTARVDPGREQDVERRRRAGPEPRRVLADVELGDSAELPPDPPVSWLTEVTDDERFTGGALARTSAAQLTRVLQDWPAAHRS